MIEVGEDVRQMFFDHACDVDDGFQAGVCRPEVPLFPVAQSPSSALVFPQVAQTFFDGPGPAGLQVHALQAGEAFLMLFGEILRREEPEVFGSLERVVVFGQEALC